MSIHKDLDGFGEAIIKVAEDYRRDIVDDLWDNLMITTPSPPETSPTGKERTGTLRANWKMFPGNTGNDNYIPKTKKRYGEPSKPDVHKYKRNWSIFTIANFSPYVNVVNNGEKNNEHNANFIQKAIAMTKLKY